jgi:hypothetical protein
MHLESLALGAVQTIKRRSPAPRGPGWLRNSEPNAPLVTSWTSPTTNITTFRMTRQLRPTAVSIRRKDVVFYFSLNK